MKVLSVLLLLALGVGAAWWRFTHPDGTFEDARREAGAVVTRLQDGALVARDEALAALSRVTSPADADGASGENASPDADAVAEAAADTAPQDADELVIDPSIDPLAAVEAVPEAAADAALDAADSDADGDASGSESGPRSGPESEAAAGTEADVANAMNVPDTELSARVTALETLLAAAPTTSSTNVVQGRLTDAERRLDATAVRETATLERLEAIDARLGRIAERLEASAIESTRRQDAADARLGSIDEALEALEAPGAPARALPDTDDAVAGDTAVDELTAANEETASRLDALSAGLDERLAAMEARLSESDEDGERLDALARRLDTFADNAAAADQGASSGPGTPSAALPASAEGSSDGTADGDEPTEASIDAAQAKIRSEIATIGEQVDDSTTSDAAPVLGEALESTRERLAALEAQVQALPASSDEADEAKATQEALETQVQALEQQLEALPKGTDPAIVSSISEVREQVDALANSGFVTQAELRETQEGRNVEYKIYFDRNSTEISDDAAGVLDSFIVQEQNRTTGVSIFGFTDRLGSASYNQRLAMERATNVRSYLIQNGLPYTAIRSLNALGEDAAAAVLPDDSADAQQRVVVLYAEQP